MKQHYSIAALFLAAAMLLASTAVAVPVELPTARDAARNFWNMHRDADVEPVAAMQSIDIPFNAFFVFSPAEGDGFVIVAADDCVMPILAYSFHNSFDLEGKDNLHYWLSGYQQAIDLCRAAAAEPDDQTVSLWKRYVTAPKDGPMPPQTLTAVPALLTTIWDQSGSGTKRTYNKFTPLDYSYSGKIYTTPTGCTATAMAQVMRYWKHPLRGTGSYSYNLSNLSPNGASQTFSSDFSQVTFEWNKMPYALSSGSTDAQINAVATLMYNCGISVGMHYAAAGSSAAVIGSRPSTQHALVNYFDYSSDIKSRLRRNFSDADWAAMLKREIDSLRPVPYAGYDESSGHAFVCDGYDASGKYHFNWGWSGSGDGYYTLANLAPGSGGVGGNATYTFNLNQQALIRVHPNGILVPPPAPAAVDDNCYITAFPYTMDFENGHTCLTIADSNRDGNKWVYATVDGKDGPTCVAFDSQNKHNSNDWLNLPKINMPGRYTVEWKAMCRNKSYPESYQVWAEDSLIFSDVHGAPNYNSATYYRKSANFKVDSGETVRVRFRCTSDDMYQFFVDDITISFIPEVSEQDTSLTPHGNDTSTMSIATVVSPACPLRISPNPAFDHITIDAPDGAAVDILDLNGRTLVQGRAGLPISVGRLAPGVYIVRATTDNSVRAGRFIKH